MKRDMELCRKILFAIKEEYEDVASSIIASMTKAAIGGMM